MIEFFTTMIEFTAIWIASSTVTLAIIAVTSTVVNGLDRCEELRNKNYFYGNSEEVYRRAERDAMRDKGEK